MKKENKETTNEAVYKSFDGLDLSKIPGSATEILTSNFERLNDCKSAQDVIALCHELFDNAKLDTAWTNKFFYQLDQIVQNNPNPRKAYEQAMLYVNNARMRGMGLGMSQRQFHEEEGSCEKTVESKSGKKYSKKQICEAIAYWQKQLDKLNESIANVDKMNRDQLLALMQEIWNRLEKGLQGNDEAAYAQREEILADFSSIMDRVRDYDGWLNPSGSNFA